MKVVHHPGKDDDDKECLTHLIGAAWGILVMALSLAAIAGLWVWFGHEGSEFSTRVLESQQARLRKEYGLPPEPRLTPEQLEVPPSLRNLTTGNSRSDTMNMTNGMM